MIDILLRLHGTFLNDMGWLHNRMLVGHRHLWVRVLPLRLSLLSIRNDIAERWGRSRLGFGS